MKIVIKIFLSVALVVGLTLGYVATLPQSNATDNNTIVLTKDNTLVLETAVDSVSVSKIMGQAQKLDEKSKAGPIYLVLETPGGDIQAGLEFISFMKSLNRPVHTITYFSASMGFQIVQGLGTRYILRFGTLMAHKAKGGFSGEFPGQLDSRYSFYLKRLDELDRITVSRTNGKLTIEQFKKMYENEFWVDGFDAINYGLADQVIGVKCDKSLDGTYSRVVNFFGAELKVVFSNCPAIRGPVEVIILNKNNVPIELIDKEIERLKSEKKNIREKVI